MLSTSATLGLDLGPNSIGWALVDESARRILGAGVRVFPEGVDRDQAGGEHSKNEQRRIARGMRRQIARRARRKKALRRALVTAGLLPEVALLGANDPRRVDWESEQFQKADPYILRARALTQRLERYEIGRILIHLNQRRGFLSNRKADRARKKENSEMLQEISTLAEAMGEQTLGQYLAKAQSSGGHLRLRGHHTHRAWYEREFEAIWEKQRAYHPSLLTDQLKFGATGKQNYPREPETANGGDLLTKFGVYGIIFFQRPMYWPKSVVGQCELEPKLKRCPRADRAAQRFRLLQEVNNLRMLDTTTGEERDLQPHERSLVIELLSKKERVKFDEIRKQFCKKFGMPEGIRFNLERGERDKLLGMGTDALLAQSKRFGKAWYDRCDEDKDRIVRTLIDDKETEATIRKRATTEWDLDGEAAENVIEAGLPEGYSSFSLVAIQKLLPHLERGLPLMTRDGTPSALSQAGYLRPDQRVVNQTEFLPEPPDLTNPLVRQALHEVRKVVNAIIREYGKPARIHIELAREVKGTAKDRAQRAKEMRQRERERDRAAQKIREAGIPINRDAKERYLLWEGQHRECVYSGRPISLVQLFGGEVDVDHILPRKRSLDNSFMNRVLCFHSENADKKDRTPHEWLAATNPAKYEAVLQRADRLPDYAKAKRFRQKSVQLDDFFARQFVDTTYITTQVHQYVRCLGADVVCTKGSHTHELRWHWGLHRVLRDDGLNLKNRDDHRHHAVDAVVIALTDRSRLQQLAGIRRQGGTERTGEVLNEPWPNFRAEVEEIINAINVSHRVQRRVQGALHEETLYGLTHKPQADGQRKRPWAKDWIEREGQFVVRKPLEALTLSMVEDIRDTSIKALVIERLRSHGIELGGDAKIPQEVWKEPLRMKSGVPVRKVRIIRRDETIQLIRGESANVKPGSVHHLCIFEEKDRAGRIRRDAVFVSMLEAVKRIKCRQPLIQRIRSEKPNGRFLMSLSANEMFLLEHEGKQSLYRFITAASTSKQMRFRHHTAAGKSADKRGVVTKKPNTLKGRKVSVDVLGRLRWAND